MWYPQLARKYPLPQADDSQLKPMKPRIICFHTNGGGGSVTALYHYWSSNAYLTGPHPHVFSHFQVDEDGAMAQYQDTHRTALAQGNGNPYCISIETQDFGNPTRPWTAKQIASIVKLVTQLCKDEGIPAHLVNDPSQAGFGYHQQFSTWNKNMHACPGSTRINQLKSVVIPQVVDALRLHPLPTKPSTPLEAIVLPCVVFNEARKAWFVDTNGYKRPLNAQQVSAHTTMETKGYHLKDAEVASLPDRV